MLLGFIKVFKKTQKKKNKYKFFFCAAIGYSLQGYWQNKHTVKYVIPLGISINKIIKKKIKEKKKKERERQIYERQIYPNFMIYGFLPSFKTKKQVSAITPLPIG